VTIQSTPPPPPRGTEPLQQDLKAFSQPWSGWFRRFWEVVSGNFAYTSTQLTTLSTNVSTLQGELAGGINVTITTAKLTTSGTEGSITFVHGILTAQTPAT
jgi:hypothetical protein